LFSSSAEEQFSWEVGQSGRVERGFDQFAARRNQATEIGGADPVSLFVMTPPFSPEWPGSLGLPFSIFGALKREAYSKGTIGAVQTFFCDQWKSRRP
jgi:hypothetical protein